MFPRWLTWLFLGVLVYMIYASSGQQQSADTSTSKAVPAINEKTYPALAEMVDGERWKRKINPDYAAKNNCTLDEPKDADSLTLKVIEDTSGEGEGAACGETITVKLTLWASNGSKAYSHELPIALGSRDIAAGLDAGLVGIKPHGTRTLLLPPSALAHAKKSTAPAELMKLLLSNKLAVITVERVN